MSQIELLTIGTELLLGLTLDTNSAEIGRALAGAGLTVVRRTSVSDRPDDIRDGAESALRRTGLVLCTGGLGPTADDVTKKVVADLFGMPLVFDESIWQAILERFARFGRKPVEKNRSQAEVPRGATVLPNKWGTAPGLWLEGAQGIAIMLPGVPHEMRNLLHSEVLPRLAQRGNGRVVRSLMVRTTGMPESTLAERIEGIEQRIAPLTLAYLPGVDGVDLRLTAWSLETSEADRRLAKAAEEIRTLLGPCTYGQDDNDLADVVLQELGARGLKVSTAESCTGGLLGARITAIAGSSRSYTGGVVAYDNEVKVRQLDVPRELIAQHGAVSAEVAEAMARGVARRFGTETSMSITGIAGPGGGTPEKPVGLVFVGVVNGNEAWTECLQLGGDRDQIRARAAQGALFQLLRRVGGR
ncbi:MAG TPA: competence/damage-inducible protein A [Gemmatimonadales bacterium]|nr:competence/damage-inducible protein A [Gemmatimonadales bacterium]